MALIFLLDRKKMRRLSKVFMQYQQLLIGIIILSASSSAFAEKISIAAASDLKFAMDEIVMLYKKSNPTDEINAIYGSSGKFFTQIQQNAPYDLYFSADISYPNRLTAEGFAVGQVKPYAIGRIVLWAPKTKFDASKMTLQSLVNADIRHIAIANPKHAPYGKRAEEALKSVDVWNKVESKLVYGENISQTAQFIQTGNAEVGIIALSLALSTELSTQGSYWIIPENLHQPLEQGFVLTKRAEHNQLAKKFSQFITTSEVRKVMAKYGFILPGEKIHE